MWSLHRHFLLVRRSIIKSSNTLHLSFPEYNLPTGAAEATPPGPARAMAAGLTEATEGPCVPSSPPTTTLSLPAGTFSLLLASSSLASRYTDCRPGARRRLQPWSSCRLPSDMSSSSSSSVWNLNANWLLCHTNLFQLESVTLSSSAKRSSF